jgi:hypothetical protein
MYFHVPVTLLRGVHCAHYMLLRSTRAVNSTDCVELSLGGHQYSSLKGIHVEV